MAQSELQILITASNQAKQVLEQLIANVGEISIAFDTLSKNLSGLNNGAAKVFPELAEQTERFRTTTEQGSQSTGKLRDQMQGATRQAGAYVTSLESIRTVLGNLNVAGAQLVSNLRFLAGGFLAFGTGAILKGLADTAARAETLGIVLRTVGANAGYSRTELEKVQKDVERLGITAASASQSLSQLIQNRIPLDFGAPLARAAQDLAVISGMNSSDTFSRLITNIAQMDTMGLRFMGIMIDREKVFADAARIAGRELDSTAKKTIFANAVLGEAAKLTGIYEASLNSAGKALGSMPRYVENFRSALGQSLLPIYLELIKGSQLLLGTLTDIINGTGEVGGAASAAGQGFREGAGAAEALASGIKTAFKVLNETILVIAKFRDEIELLTKALIALAAAFGTLAVISRVATLFTTLLGVIRAVRTGGAALAVTLATTGNVLARLSAILTPLLYRLGLVGLAAMAANPMLLAIAAAAAVAAGAFYLLSSSSEEAAASETEQAQALETLDAAYKRQIAAIKGVEDAQKGLFEATVRAEAARGTGAQKDAERKREEAKKLADTAKAELAEANKRVDEAEERLRKMELSEDNKVKFSAKQEEAKAQKETAQSLKDAAAALQEAAQRLGLAEGELTTGISSTLNKKLNDIDSSIGGVTRKAYDAAVAVPRLTKVVQDLAGSVNTAEDLDRYTATLSKLLDVVMKTKDLPNQIELANSLNSAREQAKRQVAAAEEALLAGGEEAKRFEEQQRTERASRRTQRIRSELEELRAANEQELADLQFKNEKGLLTFEQYMDQRAVLAERAFAKERELLDAQINEKNVEIASKNRVSDANQVYALETQRQALIARRRVLALQEGSDQAQRERELRDRREENENTRLELLAKTKNIESDILATLDSEQAALDKIETNLQERLRLEGEAAKNFKNDVGREGINELMSALKAQAEEEKRQAREAAEERRKRARDELNALQRDLLTYTDIGAVAIEEINKKYDDLIEARRKLARDKSVQADFERFKATAEQLRALEITLTTLDTELNKQRELLSLQRSRLAVEQAATQFLREKGRLTSLEARGLDIAQRETELGILQQELELEQKKLITLEDSLSKLDESSAQYGELTLQINDSRRAINGITGSMLSLRASIRTLGDEWRESFTDGLNRAIDDVVLRGERARDAFQNFGKSLKDQFFGTITKDFTENIVSAISSIGGEGGLFNKVANFFFPKARGDSRSNPIYAEVVNGLGSVTGGAGSGGVIGTIKETLSSIFGGIVDTFDSVFGAFQGIFSAGGSGLSSLFSLFGFAEGGAITGPGTGTSDSILARVSNGEFIVREAMASKFMPLLHAVNNDQLSGYLQSVALGVPRYSLPSFAGGGVVQAPTPGAQRGASQQIKLAIEPSALNMTLRDWLEGELGRIAARR